MEATSIDPQKLAESGYSKRVIWISTNHHIWLQVKYYDRAGAYTKVLLASDIRLLEGTDKWRPHYLSMEDVRSDKKTVLEYSDYKINQDVLDIYFSQRYLKRGR